MGSERILAVGHINWDVVMHMNTIPTPDHSERLQNIHKGPGGSATNTALLLADSEVDTVLAGSLGDDEWGDMVRSFLDDSQLEYYTTNASPTTNIYALLTDDADPRYLAQNEPVGEYESTIVPDEVWDKITHLHITSFSEYVSKSFVERAVEEGVTISFNPSQVYSEREFPHIVENADVIFLNKREAEIFRQRQNLGQIAESGTSVIITHGGAGCTAYESDGISTHSGFPVSDVVDTVGAGDSFIAGFLSEWVTGSSTEECLERANQYGAMAVQAPGAPNEVASDSTPTK